MGLYFLKPVVWNSNNYLQPSGAKFTSGYPRERGFGHEEWNNSKRYLFWSNRKRFRVFHTEGFGNQPLAEFAGQIFVFMIASYSGSQYLVAVAGRATSLFGGRNKDRRERLLRKIGLVDDRWKDAWAVERVRKAHGGSLKKFLRRWKDELHWLPTWTCPAEYYLGLRSPLLLSPQALTGRRRLIGMYGSYQEIGRHTALKLLDIIAEREGTDNVSALTQAVSTSDVDMVTDVSLIDMEGPASETTRAALVDARLGQGKFRTRVLAAWGGCCAATGCSVSEILRASHIKPWRDSSNNERLDSENGLPLTGHLDLLFDSGLITFDNNGDMLVSDRLSRADRSLLNLGGRLRRPLSVRQRMFLKHHRERVFRRGSLA